MQSSAQPKELYHEFSIIIAHEVPPESKQKENSKPAPKQFNADMKEVLSKQEGKQEWTCDRLHCENPPQNDSQSGDAQKELLLP